MGKYRGASQLPFFFYFTPDHILSLKLVRMVQSTLALVLTGLAATVVAQSCDINDLSVSYPAPEAHSDWTYRLIARDLTKPRSILFDSESNLIVLDAGEGIVHFNFDDEGDTCLSVNEQTTLLEDEDLNHGLALSDDGETLYASTMDEVYSWPYNAQRGELDEDNRRTLVTNMSNSDHTTRTLLLSGNTLIVSRGSDSNQDPDAEDLSSGHSQIRSFNLSSIPDDSPMDFMDGDLWGWGLRNAVGLALDPVHNGLWSVENSVDELHRSGEDIHRDNPGEELNFHGFLNGTFPSPLSENTTENNYGYPLCFALWGTDNFPDLGSLETGDQFPDEDNSDATDESCNEDYVSPVLAFQAHTAPLDILFSEDGSEAFISFHGSCELYFPLPSLCEIRC